MQENDNYKRTWVVEITLSGWGLLNQLVRCST
jgi:hypothetical protein